MPMTDYGATPQMKMRKKQGVPPAAPEGVDYGDGELIPPMPPMPRGPHQMPDGTMMGGANQGGGPSGPPPDMRSGIFQSLYDQGRQMGNTQMMDMMAPPVEEEDFLMPPDTTGMPGFAPAEPPFAGLSIPPTQPPPMSGWPIHLQQGGGMAPQGPISRFPRAQSLLSGMRSPMPRRRRQGG